ncbi:MAG: tetratricopeptide repeat protein [Saprospiraceae bacterium]
MARSYAEAEPVFKKAIALDPAYANPRKHLGMVCFKTNRPEEARQHFLKAIALNPNYVAAMLGMACLLASEDKTDEALAYVEQVIGKGSTSEQREGDKDAKSRRPKATSDRGSTFEQLERDEDLAPLRALPAWKELMKKHFPDKVKD